MYRSLPKRNIFPIGTFGSSQLYPLCAKGCSQVRSHRRRRKFAWNSLERSTPICTQSCALYYTTWTFSELFMVSILKATPCRAWRGRMDRLFLKVARVTRSMHHVLSFWFVWVISLWRLHSYSALVTSEGKREAPFFFIQATRNVQKCITLPVKWQPNISQHYTRHRITVSASFKGNELNRGRDFCILSLSEPTRIREWSVSATVSSIISSHQFYIRQSQHLYCWRFKNITPVCSQHDWYSPRSQLISIVAFCRK